MYKSIKNLFDLEYHQLSLWYFVSFIFGIIYSFAYSNLYNLQILLMVIVISYLLGWLIRNSYEISSFFIMLVVSFVFGIMVTEIRVHYHKTEAISQMFSGEIKGKIEQITPTVGGVQIILDEVKLNNINTKVRINVKGREKTNYQAGDHIKVRVKLFPLQSSILPDTYNFGFYLYLQGIGATGYALSEIEKVGSKKERSFYTLVNDIRGAIYARIIKVLGERNGNFVAAILIGETSGIDKDTYNAVRNSGIAHILSVSGLHLTLVAMIFFISSRVMLNLSNYIAYNYDVKMMAGICGILGSLVYLFLSGTKVAATRAFIMTSLYIFAVIIGRSPYPLRSVFFAAFLILLFSPEYVLHPSFQLSFTAVLCLISGYELYARYQYIFGESGGVIGSIKMYVLANIYTSFLASFVTGPFVIYHFYKFANYSVFMNLVAVPLMSFIMMPVGLLAMISFNTGLDYYCLKLVGICVDVIINSAAKLVSLPGAIWHFGYITPISLAIFTLGFFGICIWQTRFRLYCLIPMIASSIMMLQSPKPDFIYDVHYKAVGLKNNQGKLEIFTNKPMPEFTSTYWANWFGQEKASSTLMPIHEQDLRFATNDGKTISLNYNSCIKADVMLVTSKFLNCSTDRILVDYEQLKGLKSLIIFCDKDQCNVKVNKVLDYE